jgi:dolichyl-phosphate-mannose-protein mannosyltransferase
VVLPAVIYVASFAGRVDGSLLAWPFSEGAWLRSVLDRQLDMLSFHLRVPADHPYASPAWSWPLIRRAIPYFVAAPGGRYRLVLAVGNPLVWWGSLVAFVYAAQDWVRRRGDAQGVILAGFLAAWLPWVLLGAARRLTFLFYLLPAVPFMCLAVADVLRRAVGSRIGRAAGAMTAAALVASFLFYYPVLTARPLTLQVWEARVLFQQCGRLPARDEGDRRVREVLAHAEETPGPYPEALARKRPPPGWCWI